LAAPKRQSSGSEGAVSESMFVGDNDRGPGTGVTGSSKLKAMNVQSRVETESMNERRDLENFTGTNRRSKRGRRAEYS
jgi:hypothetical protein